jgi:CSLREA domain-containing protein
LEPRDPKRVRRAGLAAGAATAGAFALAAPAQGAIFQVNDLGDGAPNACDANCTLRDALTLANGNSENDTITFLSTLSGTIRLQGGDLPIHNLAPDYGITIEGPGASQLEISGDSDNNGSGNYRIFNIPEQTSTTTISGLTLTEGFTGSSGGAIALAKYSSLELDNVTITNSHADSGGGGIVTEPFTFLEITNSTISGNETGGGGGGGGLSSYGFMTVSDSRVTGNTAGGNGGGGILRPSSKYSSITGSTINGNQTTGKGGGLSMGGGKYPVEVTDTTIAGNTATLGGAGIVFRGLGAAQRVKVVRTTISGNQGGPSSFGGGVRFDYGTSADVRFLNSTISGNSADVGGGVSFGSTSNDAVLSNGRGSIELANSTVARNTATSRGGGLYLDRYDPGSGFISPTIPLTSTIVADNTAGGAKQDLDRANGSGGGGFDTAFSLIERRGDAPLIQSPPGSNVLGVDPKLGPLKNNGGSTQTQKPKVSSKAIDHGDSSRLDTDQRGRNRLVHLGILDTPTGNGTDIGAVELQRSEIPNEKCAGKLATIIGDGKVINGTKRADIISGTQGKNVIRGRGGNDIICGGKGKDKLFGGPGKDRLIGGPGRDRVHQ